MIFSIAASVLVSAAVTITFICMDILRLERRYMEKDRLLDDQLAALRRSKDDLDEITRAMQARLSAIDRATKVITPFADSIGKVY